MSGQFSNSINKNDPSFEKKIQQMELLLLHSVCGYHALFDNQEIIKAVRFSSSQNSNDPNLTKKIEDLIANLVDRKSFNDKVLFLKNLDQESHSLVVLTYLEIVEGALRNLHPLIH